MGRCATDEESPLPAKLGANARWQGARDKAEIVRSSDAPQTHRTVHSRRHSSGKLAHMLRDGVDPRLEPSAPLPGPAPPHIVAQSFAVAYKETTQADWVGELDAIPRRKASLD